MPFATHGGVRLYWRVEGVVDGPPLVLLHAIGTDSTLWDRTAFALVSRFRVLRIDLRGHGASDAPDGDYTLAMLAGDVAAVMEAAGVGPAAVAGVSLGGMVAMQLTLDRPDLVTALAPICTSPAMDAALWDGRVRTVRTDGLAAIADAAMGRFLSPAFAAAHPALAAGVRAGLLGTSATGYAGAGAAIRDMALLPRLPRITAPTLVLAGAHDLATPLVGHADRIAALVPGARLVTIDASHLAPVDNPGAVADALVRFLADPGAQAAERALFEAGTLNRRRVLGNAWVDRSVATDNGFNAEFQAMITRTAWQEIWGRPGLDDRTRRLLVIVMTASLARWEEFRLHVRSGLERSGFTVDELKETLMQVAVYAGVPAANTAFAEAGPIVDACLAARGTGGCRSDRSEGSGT